MKNKTMKISIIIPVYNSEKWIAKTIDSVINQSYTNWTAVIINDCSTDNTLDVINNKILNNDKFMVVNRDINGGPLSSIVNGTNAINCEDNDIIINLDGDKKCLCDDCLNTLIKFTCSKEHLEKTKKFIKQQKEEMKV